MCIFITQLHAQLFLRQIQGCIQASECFVLCSHTVRSLNNDRIANGHMSTISSNTSLIAHTMGDIGYFLHYKEDSMGAAILVRYRKCSDFLFGSVLQSCRATVQSYICCVCWPERNRALSATHFRPFHKNFHFHL